MKRLLAAILLVSMLCTSTIPVYAHGAEDPCGKGCPLIEKDIWTGDDQNQWVVISYLYECGNKVEDYFNDVLRAYAICNYSEDVIKQYVRLENGSYQFSLISAPVRQTLVNEPIKGNVVYNTGDDGYKKVKSGGSCAYAPNYKCDLYVKPFNGEKVIYESFAWDIVVGEAAAAVVAYITKTLTGFKIPRAEFIAMTLVKLLNGNKVSFDSQHNLHYNMYDAIDMCRGIVNGTCVQETIYKKEQHRIYYTYQGILIDDIVSVIGQYDKEEEFMSYCIGRYHNEYHSPNHTYLYECSKICEECGGGNRSASHDYLPATCVLPKRCKWCGITDGEALGHFYNSGSCDTPKTCIRCKATTGSPLGHNYSAATCTEAKTCTRCGATSGSSLGHSYSGATCTSAATCIRCGATSGSSLGHSYSAATCTSAKKCTRCGVTSGSVLGHSYSAATCTSAATCIRCGATSGSSLGHNYSEATCTSAKKCTRCGVTSGSALGHNYSAATCTSAKKCTRCGVTSGSALGHSYSAATCTSAKKCTRCGLTDGSALGHSYSAATCTSAKKCTRCGVTSGSALGHNYSAATCTSAKKCTRCGVTSGSALGHNYSAATCTSAKKCTRCGLTDGSALGHSYSSWSFFDRDYHIRTCSRCKISEKALHRVVTLGCATCGWKGETIITRTKKINNIQIEEIIINE